MVEVGVDERHDPGERPPKRSKTQVEDHDYDHWPPGGHHQVIEGQRMIEKWETTLGLGAPKQVAKGKLGRLSEARSRLGVRSPGWPGWLDAPGESGW